MAGYRKKTLRSMSPVTRKVARLIGESASVSRRLKNVLPEIQDLEKRDLERAEEMDKVLNRLAPMPEEEK